MIRLENAGDRTECKDESAQDVIIATEFLLPQKVTDEVIEYILIYRGEHNGKMPRM